ncbi:MAG: leucine-rich repeat domain-containing protein [Treponema sp.]|jgi:hypothetical protein|nr:leucine-rich repeat domain-containing protein [Treponema sp.]
MKIKLKIMIPLCVILISGCAKQEVSQLPTKTAALEVTGSVTVISDVAGTIIIDGKETGTRIKSNGTATINDILNGDTEFAVKLDNGTIVRAADMVSVRSGETVTVQIRAMVEQPEIAETPVISRTPSVAEPERQIQAAVGPAQQKIDKLTPPTSVVQSVSQNQTTEQTGSQNQQNDTSNVLKTEQPPAASAPTGRIITSDPRDMPGPTIRTVDTSLIEAARQAQQRRAAGDVWDTEEGEGGLVITYYRDTEKVIQIPEKINGRSVVAIGDDAFEGKGLASVTIPPSVIYIGKSAFENNELHSIVIPPGVKYIGENAFYHNELVYGITIGANVELGRNAIGEEGTEYDFVDFYTRNGKKTGTYTLTETSSGWKWNYQAR